MKHTGAFLSRCRPTGRPEGPFLGTRRQVGKWEWLKQRAKVSAILVVWLFSIGAHWDAAQIFAWGRMLARHAESMSIVQAAKQTLGGEMCDLCKAVNTAKQQERETPVPSEGLKSKVVLACTPVPRLIFADLDIVAWSPGHRPTPLLRRSAPPSPPPKDRRSYSEAGSI